MSQKMRCRDTQYFIEEEIVGAVMQLLINLHIMKFQYGVLTLIDNYIVEWGVKK